MIIFLFRDLKGILGNLGPSCVVTDSFRPPTPSVGPKRVNSFHLCTFQINGHHGKIKVPPRSTRSRVPKAHFSRTLPPLQ